MKFITMGYDKIVILAIDTIDWHVPFIIMSLDRGILQHMLQ